MPAHEVRIVEASPSDLARLHELVSPSLTHETLSSELLGEKLFGNPHPDQDEYHTLIAEVDGQPRGLLQHVIRANAQSAWLGLFAVVDEYRRRGVATRLFQEALAAWRAREMRVVSVLTIPTNYLVPGVDPRYTAAVCFLESLGFTRTKEVVNMRVWLDREFETAEQEAALRQRGIAFRRADAADHQGLERFFGRIFGDGWLAEVCVAMRRRPPAVHLALRDGEIVGFAAHSTMNAEQGNFGPMGVVEDVRRLGLGRVLLFRALADLRAAGFNSAVIPWVGPYSFYSRLVDARIERVFWQYRLELQA